MYKEKYDAQKSQTAEKIVHIESSHRMDIIVDGKSVKKGKIGVSVGVRGTIGRLYGVKDQQMVLNFETRGEAARLVEAFEKHAFSPSSEADRPSSRRSGHSQEFERAATAPCPSEAGAGNWSMRTSSAPHLSGNMSPSKFDRPQSAHSTASTVLQNW
eukprot:CAMPEP_0113663448 /NCGR_PEP_ID=MMETSP0038_2-20120614/1147_1 /TAXON_ID=2898 /ORGANISM="Cryptomonas paramecium" /LENGTH=156 /DNA_ID=CAMNT_0000578475 /DNA_START=204 /DNA_END=674 /DNA_ORIENTATION=+ /assembly_acc=CAM_ASM_000170